MQKPFAAAALAALLLAACDRGPTDPSLTPDLRTGTGTGFLPAMVVTMTNATAGNEALVFPRAPDGTLGAPTAYPTGGTGTGGGLGNQGGVIAADDGRTLYTVNAGSNSISVFAVGRGGLDLIQTIGSEGQQPISLTRHGDLLYVLNDGGAANIAGFRVAGDGTLSPIPGATAALSTAAPDAAQISFGRFGTTLVVTEKGTNSIVVFPVDGAGRPGIPTVSPSSGATPFGFALDRLGNLVISEAFGGAPGASAVSSYRIGENGLRTISASVGTTQTAACWVLVTADGRFAYTTNTGSNSVTGYAIGGQGTLTLVDPAAGTTGAGPIDMAESRGGSRFVYVLNGGDGTISAFARHADGSLSPLGTAPTGGRTNGLVAF